MNLKTQTRSPTHLNSNFASYFKFKMTNKSYPQKSNYKLFKFKNGQTIKKRSEDRFFYGIVDKFRDSYQPSMLKVQVKSVLIDGIDLLNHPNYSASR